jgi:thimet oligopeptidase
MPSFPFPNDPIQASLTKESLIKKSDTSLALANELRSAIATLDSELTWDNTFGVMDRISFALAETVDIPALFALVHPNADMRETARLYEPLVSAFLTDLYMDSAVYHVLKRAESTLTAINDEQKKLIQDILRDYRRNGLDLPSKKQGELKKLNEELTGLAQIFEKNIAESTVSIRVTPDQLSGLPDSFIASHLPDADNLVTITSDPPDIVPFLRYANDRTLALELFIKNENRSKEKNLPILDRVIDLRRKKAKLLGYETWADYVLEDRMAKTPKNAKTFLDTLHAGLKPIREKEVELIKKTAISYGKPTDEAINDPDSVYYSEKVRNIEYGLDSKVISEYFEIRSVEQGLFEIASSLFDITFRPVPTAPTWHSDARAFDVIDKEQNVFSRFYLDLYPRDDKFKHAAMFTIRSTMQLEDGTRVVPSIALVCNFQKPTENQPSLLDHGQVTTLFHEFGHCLHLALSRSHLASFSGTRVAQDFVEVPSQLFEEWAWERETLDRFARHYKTGELIPDDLFKAMQEARRFGQGIGTDRQLLYANLDLAYHTRTEVDTTEILKELFAEYSPFERVPDTYFQTHFGHLMGYDASYYSYQWALSIAKDVFTRFQTTGIMSTDTAQAYLKSILERGGSEDEEKMVESFLGRPSSPSAYLEFLGIKN